LEIERVYPLLILQNRLERLVFLNTDRAANATTKVFVADPEVVSSKSTDKLARQAFQDWQEHLRALVGRDLPPGPIQQGQFYAESADL
jgi:hypothetical protein